MKLISTDSDGERILDSLGPVFVELMKPGEAKIIAQLAYDFVMAQHRQLLSKGDAKLRERYGLLRRYFESRLPQWGLAASNQ